MLIHGLAIQKNQDVTGSEVEEELQRSSTIRSSNIGEYVAKKNKKIDITGK